MDDMDPLLKAVEEALVKHGLTPTQFGKRAVANPSFVFNLRKGREPRRAQRQKVETFIESLNTTAPQQGSAA